MKKLLLVFLMLSFGGTGFSQNSPVAKVVEPVIFQQEVQKDVQLVDVRTPQEYDAGHIQGSENVDYLSKDFKAKMAKYDKQKPLYIYCKSGNRSGKSAVILSEMGFENIIDLKGGYNAWTKFEKE